MNERCSEVDTWIRDLRAADAEPPQALRHHVGGCSRCRGVALAMVADLTGSLRPIANLTCDAAEPWLPDLVDHERALGLAAAVGSFPAVWWHTITCPNCDLFYRSLHALATQPARPWAPARPARRAPTPITIRLAAGMIRRMLGADQRLGQAWGADQPDMVIAEEQEELGDIRISLRRDSTGAISLVVRVEPPFAGVALISVAGDRLQAPLDDAGCAHFCGLPEALLVADGAADLTVMIDATC